VLDTSFNHIESLFKPLPGGNQNNNKAEVGQGFRPLRPAVQSFPNMVQLTFFLFCHHLRLNC